ncbi:unnamed protein product [Clonostachys rhizophaga]|uniref:Aldehyde dehydrogenase domain-containing protein n=1 Tax=Clonostachys rhizophaga TaxID=160324 RepID=A0A9N9VYD0_9HYPO|nr:unnamed protein product [Clonostachys rhizophaga]
MGGLPNGNHTKTHFGTNLPLIVDGKDVTTGNVISVISPLTDKEVWTASAASTKEALDAVTAAEKAFPAWSKTKPSERRDLFLRAAELFLERKKELQTIIHHEIGADEHYQEFIIGLAVEGLKDTAGRIASAVEGHVPASTHDGMRALIQKKPYGVILGIAPWNAPYHLGLRSISFALAAGNTTVLKGSELSPLCYWAIADIFRQAGLPDGCLNLILHRPQDAAEVTSALIADPRIRKVNFTGSSGVGSIIASLCGQHLKPVLLELGGKASAIVMGDADLENAAKHCALGAFMNAGQICMSTERVVVHASVASKFQQLFTEAVDRHFSSATNKPALITSASAKRNKDLVQDALSKGAQLLHGDKGSTSAEGDVATKMSATILSGINEDMKLYATESFGPSTSLFVYDSEEEALRLVNDTEYGLSAAIFTNDLGKAFRFADGLESGAVHINSMTVHDEFALPHGGVKKSGYGRFNGSQGLDEFLYYKSVTWME